VSNFAFAPLTADETVLEAIAGASQRQGYVTNRVNLAMQTGLLMLGHKEPGSSGEQNRKRPHA